VARRLQLIGKSVGETLLTSKLQILNGTGNRRPSIALSILTGRVAEQLSILENFYREDPAMTPTVVAPVDEPEQRGRPQMLARTVYLSETHLRDIDAIIQSYSQAKRITRSAIVRRALEHLRAVVEDQPGSLNLMPLENE